MTTLKFREASDSHTYRITLDTTDTVQMAQVCRSGDSNIFSVC